MEDSIKKRFSEIQKQYEDFRKRQVEEDPDLVNVDSMTKQKIIQGVGHMISPEEFQKMNARQGKSKPVPPPYQGEVAPLSETSPESQAAYARTMEMMKQREKDKALAQHLAMSPEERLKQQQITLQQKVSTRKLD